MRNPMAQAFAVSEPVMPLRLSMEYEKQTINVRVIEDSNTLIAEPAFIRIDEVDAASPLPTLLKWQLVEPPEGWLFDTPGIVFIGDTPNITRLPPEQNVRSMLWMNDAPFQGRSYTYRVNLLRKNDDGSYTSFSIDPTVHNEPPPAP